MLGFCSRRGVCKQAMAWLWYPAFLAPLVAYLPPAVWLMYLQNLCCGLTLCVCEVVKKPSNSVAIPTPNNPNIVIQFPLPPDTPQMPLQSLVKIMYGLDSYILIQCPTVSAPRTPPPPPPPPARFASNHSRGHPVWALADDEGQQHCCFPSQESFPVNAFVIAVRMIFPRKNSNLGCLGNHPSF